LVVKRITLKSKTLGTKASKQLRDSDLRSAVRGGLIFRDLSNADERMKSIGRMVEGAMRQIASESRMNAKRVKNFGVQIVMSVTLLYVLMNSNGGASSGWNLA
jgi:hypothetical protein